jgi:lysyl-tRNA synthetase class 2
MEIAHKKQVLQKRHSIIKNMREFFWSKGFEEVETPILLRVPGQEPYLSPMKLNIHNERGVEFAGYLHTSPEYTMKKMLAAGFGDIFSICKTFRDVESFGGDHNPEFTMLEWYRVGVDFESIMDDAEMLLSSVGYEKKVERVHMRDMWKEYVDVNLDEYLNTEKMRELCIEKGYTPAEDERYEDLFYRIFLNDIEPKLKHRGAVILHHYPAQMAALAKLSQTEKMYAERFELYIDGIEVANAFSELTDATEQRERLEEEQELRKKLGKDVYDIDEEFVKSVGNLPKCAGIALGIDRLVMILTDCQEINDVLVLPAKELFN